jgi:hypothetical protein
MAEPSERSDKALWQTLNQLQQRLESLEKAVYKQAQAESAESVELSLKSLASASAAPVAAPIESKPAAAVQAAASVPSPTPVQPVAPAARQPQPPPLPPEAFGGKKPSDKIRPGIFADEDISLAPFRRNADAIGQQQTQRQLEQQQKLQDHAPAPKEPAAAVQKIQAAPRQSLEQRLGTRWILIVGLALLVLTGVYFFQYMAERKWINEGVRLLIGTGAGLLMVGMGEYWRRKLRLFAAGISAGGIVLLYLVVFVASRNGAAVLGEGYHKLYSPMDFICMCLVTLLGMGVAIRNGLLLSGVLSLVGALATPILLSTGKNAQVALMTYLLLVNAGFLALAVIQRWQALAPLAMAGTAFIFAGWFCKYGDAADSPRYLTTTFGWLFFGLYAAYGLVATRLKRASSAMSPAMLLVMMVLMGVLWVPLGQGGSALMSQMLVLNAVVLGLCLYQRWNGLAVLAMLQTAVTVVICFGRLTAEPTSTNLFAWAHAGIFALFALLAPRFFKGSDGISRCILAAAMVLLGALWVNLNQSPVSLLSQLLILDLAVLAICLWRWWQELAPLALVVTAVLMAIETWHYYEDRRVLDVFAWVFAGVFATYAIAAWRMGRAHVHVAIGLISACCPLLVALWLAMEQADWAVLLQMFVLDLAVVVLCLLARWNWLRAGAMAWTVVGLLSQHQWGRYEGEMAAEVFWSAWIWAFFSMFTADLLVRAWRRVLASLPDLDAVLAGVCNLAMFECTYLLLDPSHHPWMGAYTFALGAAAIALAWVVRRKADRRPLAYAYFGTGLTLVTLAMPIQFSLATLTLAWAIEAVVLMLLAKRLSKWLLLTTSIVVLSLAVGHFFIKDLIENPAIGTVLLAPLGVHLTLGLALAMALTLACLLTAALLRTGQAVIDPPTERGIAYTLAIAGVLIYGVRTACELPPMAATWWWLTLACILAVVAAWRRSGGLVLFTVALLFIAAAKWLFFDTLTRRMLWGPEPELTVLFNWQMFAGLALTASLLVFLRRCTALGLSQRSKRLGKPPVVSAEASPKVPVIGLELDHAIVLLAAVLVVWGGSFEVDRYLGLAANELSSANPQKAMALQMGYSWWWAIYALAVLVIGFVVRRAPLRWFAIALLGLALCKIVYVIYCNVESIYRVLALLGVSILLLTAAWLYNRYFRKVKPVQETNNN